MDWFTLGEKEDIIVFSVAQKIVIMDLQSVRVEDPHLTKLLLKLHRTQLGFAMLQYSV